MKKNIKKYEAIVIDCKGLLLPNKRMQGNYAIQWVGYDDIDRVVFESEVIIFEGEFSPVMTFSLTNEKGFILGTQEIQFL